MPAFAGYVAVHLFIVAGLSPAVYNDSPTYTILSFTGNAPQLPTVPLLYTIFPSDAGRVFSQALLAALCWWWLAAVASGLVNDRRVRTGVWAIFLALGVVSPIANWNTTILSESSAISLTAALVAAWIRYASRPSWRSAVVGVGVTIAWTFTRQAHVVLGLMITAIAIGAVLGRRRSVTKVAVAAVLVFTSMGALAIVGRNHRVSNGNVADIIEDRILPNPMWTSWFIAAGMPYSRQIASTANGPEGDALIAMPLFERWLTAHGTNSYLHFILSHPNYTLFDPLPYFSGEESSLEFELTPAMRTYPFTDPNPTPSMLSPTADYGRHREVLPAVVTGLLFEQGQIGDVLVLAGGAGLVFVVARRRNGRDRRQWIPMLLLASVVPQGYFVWLGGGVGELDRLSIVVAVSVRIALWLVAAFALDHLFEPTPPPVSTSTARDGGAAERRKLAK